ncbi:glycoside hydrolase family 3 protein [Venturia nashicola]|uniref:beta-glucosidase n=1 Tax=Venturia nashicola TaxID=86259 RepID=A0A4Z1NRI6_9PEZI|nr:glycoside hydrolase family 3 protein [Venturia nashicola]
MAAQLSLEEQVALLSGADFWRTVALPHRGIPSMKTTDGPSGARGEFFVNGTPAALFPCGISLAATWNTELVEEVGQHLGEETKARGADVLLAPTVCIHRAPLGGRNFESFSEDPFLTGKLAANFIRGVQSQQVAATIKHFVANEQETHRMTVDSIVQERPLREIYLKPFEIAIRDCSPWALMTSYNLVNGIHADVNDFILRTVLRDEWKYDGTIISDWTALTDDTGVKSIQAGCDLEMPGPAKRRGRRVVPAVESGEISSNDVERAAGNILHLIERTKGLDEPTEKPERANDNPATRSIIRQAGVEGLTLLKNDGNVLPIKNAKKIAVIGPNAKRAIVGGGGSAKVNPYYTVTPFEGIAAATDAEVVFAQGSENPKWLPLASRYCKTPNGKQGVFLEFFRGDKFQGEPLFAQHKETTDLYLWDSAPKAVLPDYSFRVKASLTPETTGVHTFSLSSVGPGRLFLNGELFIDNWNWTEEGEAMFDDSKDIRKAIQLEAGVSITIVVESTSEIRPLAKKSIAGTHGYGGCRIGYQEEVKTNMLEEAVQTAKESDVAVVIVGLDNEWESEGYDRQTMDLPKDGSQDRLIEAVFAANPNTVVINQSGSPVAMPWADKVPAILQAWYQGQEAGNALGDVLFGKHSPSGKLPTTFPRRLEDTPAYHNWPGENLKVVYGEGIYVGYRHYERTKIEPLFPFGHGLTYTHFSYGEVRISERFLSNSSPLVISVPITNDGVIAAHEVVQLYIRDVKSRLPRPDKELQGFAKIFLQPGETKMVQLAIDKHSVGYYDTSLASWIAEEGLFHVLIGASSADIRSSASFEVEESFTWTF